MQNQLLHKDCPFCQQVDRCRDLEQRVDTLTTEKAKLASDFRKTDIKHAKERFELKRHIGNLQNSDTRRSIRDLKHENRSLRQQQSWVSDEREKLLHEAIEGYVIRINELKDELSHSDFLLRDIQADYEWLTRKRNQCVDSELALAKQYANIIQSQQAAHTKHCAQLRTLLDGDNLSATLKQTSLALANTQAELDSCTNAWKAAQHQCLAARILGGNEVRKQQHKHDQEKRECYKLVHDTESRKRSMEADLESQLSDARSNEAHLHRLIEAQQLANVKLSTELQKAHTHSGKKRKRRKRPSSHTGDSGEEGSMHQQAGATTRARTQATDNTGDSHDEGSTHQQAGAITRSRAKGTDS